MDRLNLNAGQNNSDIFIEKFHSLPMGDKFIVTSNTNLDPNMKQLEERYINVVEYEYIKEGPHEWEAVVSKKAYNFI